MKIFVSRQLPISSIHKLSDAGHDVHISEFDRVLASEEFLKKAQGADAVLTLLTDKIDGEVVDAIGPQLKIVSNYAVGFDNIKVDELTQKGIVVSNTPCDEVNIAVAEHTWALLLALSRRVVEADESTRNGAYKGWEPGIFLGPSLVGKTLGVIGLGRIGTMAASRAKAFGMNVIYNKRSRDEEAEREFGVEFRELNDLLSQSDFLSLHVPLTDETHHMINSETISKMKNGVYIINTARGAIINESHLVDALLDGKVRGAALDVFDNEPNINPELVAMENVILTPHIASATHEAREKMGDLAINAILDTFNNQKPQNIVNDDVWENRRK